MSTRAELGPTAPLPCSALYTPLSAPAGGGAQLSSAPALLLRILPISGDVAGRARPDCGPGQRSPEPPGGGGGVWLCGARPGRQCVMVMLTCPTFVIHLCDNWDRCFHVHPQCVSNQGQRLVNTVQDKSRATSPDRNNIISSPSQLTATAASA